MKKCTQCHKEFPATTEFFHSDVSKSTGLAPSCKTCKVAKTLAWARKHPEQARATRRRNWRKNGRTYELRKHYGITAEIYDAKLKEQSGVCAICKQPPKKQRLAVDHNHRNKKNRGLLCALCNHAVERVEQDLNWGSKAVEYLQKYQEA